MPDIETIDSALEALVSDPDRAAILSDVDGTLAPITERPEQTTVPQGTRDLLASLCDRYALVGCISGRRASEAQRIVGVEGIHYSGNHGLEMLRPGEIEPQFDLALRGHEHAAASFIDHFDGGSISRVGMRLEDKGPIQALHWRGVPDEAAARQLADKIAALATDHGLHVHRGRKVLEIRPSAGVGKDAAVGALLEDPAIRTAIYAGDDNTDLDAFRRMREMVEEGMLDSVICVGISSTEGPSEIPAESDLVVPDQSGWVEILRRLDR